MIPYYLFFGFFGLGAALDYFDVSERSTRVLREFVIYFGFFLILFFVGLRYKIASDWASYIQFYAYSPSFLELFRNDNLAFSNGFIEPGFKILMAICKDIGLDFFAFVFLITFFNTISLYCFLKYNNIRRKIVFLAIILILTTFAEFDILRQELSLHIILFSIRKNYISFWKKSILVLLGIAFHFSAVIFFLFFLFSYLKINRFFLEIVTTMYFISLFLSLPIITTSFTLLSPFVGGGLEALFSKTANLIDDYGFSRNISLTTLLNLLFLICLTWNIRRIKLTNSEEILLKVFLFYIIINIFFKEIKEIADRFSYFFSFGVCFMFCLMPELVPFKEKRWVFMTIPFIFISLRLFLHFQDPAIFFGQVPYRNLTFKTFYDEHEIIDRFEMMQNIGSKNIEKQKK